MHLAIAIDEFVGYCRSHRDLSQLSVRAYASDLPQFLSDVRATTAEPSIEDSKMAVGEYLLRLRSKVYMSATIRRKIASLRTFFSHAESMAWIMNQPMRWKEVRVLTSPSLPKDITDVDLVRILSAAVQNVSQARAESQSHALACRDLAMIGLTLLPRESH